MCDINAYILNEGKEELYLENVDVVKPKDDTIVLINLFGEQMVFEGQIKEISLIKHKIILESPTV